MKKDYQKQVLNGLLDKYERSSLARGTNQVRVRISYPVTKRAMPEYFDETSTAYVTVHEQLEALEARGWIKLIWKGGHEGHILEKCVLNPTYLEAIYAFLGRMPRKERERIFLEKCRKIRQELKIDGRPSHAGRTLSAFLTYIETRVERGESIAQYASLDDLKGFDGLCRMVYGILTNEKECFLREFSIRIFHDSKAAEKELGKACRVIREFSDDSSLEELTNDELLAEYMIYRNPSWIMMKGSGRLAIGDGRENTIDLSRIPGGFAVTDESVPYVHWLREDSRIQYGLVKFGNETDGSSGRPCEKNASLRIPVILTIENLTTFHRWNLPEIDGRPVICLYLGGYVNPIRRTFLKKIYQVFPDAEYLHFGDIDCGGFRIWHHLAKSTEIPFKPFLMGPDVLRQYLTECRPLSDTDQKTLEKMLNDPAYSKVRPSLWAMRETGRKLEQESVNIERIFSSAS